MLYDGSVEQLARRCSLSMGPELAPLRRAHELLKQGNCVDDVIDELRRLFGLDFVDAMAAVAASVVLT